MTHLKIVSEKEQVQEEVVDALRRLLTSAEKGEIIGFYGVVICADGDHETLCTATLSRSQRMGCLVQALVDCANSGRGE